MKSTSVAAKLTMALAQGAPERPGDSPHSKGRTVAPETDGKQQPQGNTGPLDTTQGRRSSRFKHDVTGNQERAEG